MSQNIVTPPAYPEIVVGRSEAVTLTPTLPAAAEPFSSPIQRLVVLTPDAEVNESRLAAKLWSMASTSGQTILLLGLARDMDREARVRRRLASLSAIVRDKRTRVETRIGLGARWAPLVQSVWQAGDLLVCHAEQSQPTWGGLGREPLALALATKLKIPVYAVAGFYPHLPPELPEWVSRSLALLPLVAILIIFLLIQFGIQRFTTGWAQTALLFLSVVVEYVLMAAWETFVARQSL